MSTNKILSIFLWFQFCRASIYTDEGGPSNWPNLYKTCGGKRQSPIPLPCPYIHIPNEKFPPLVRSDTYFKVPQSISVTRNDKTVTLKPIFANGANVKVSGGPLKDTYILTEIHFHWGDKDTYGSEHTIIDMVFAMEAHAVHYNSKYKSYEDAQTKSDGLMVIAYLYTVVPNTTSLAMDSLTKSFSFIQQKDVETTNIQTGFPLVKLFPDFQDVYLTYSGSLTTPPCYETVTWIVRGPRIDISRNNIARFRAFYNVEPRMRNNFRPLQDVNGRKIVAKGNCK